MDLEGINNRVVLLLVFGRNFFYCSFRLSAINCVKVVVTSLSSFFLDSFLATKVAKVFVVVTGTLEGEKEVEREK